MTTPTTLTPTTEAIVNARASYGFSCYVKLSDTEKILVELSPQAYDPTAKAWVTSSEKEKFQLEELQYHLGYGDDNATVTFHNAILRGFRKDGALRFRTNYTPHHNTKELLAQIPDHYHDYARKQFQVEMAELQKKVSTTIQNGVVIK